MQLFVYNPNSSAAMTALIARQARAAAGAGVTILAGGASAPVPPSIEGHHDAAMAVPPMLDALRRAEAAGADAHVIACFDDPGIAAAREVVQGPVIGIAQAAMQIASLLASRFSIVTTLPRSVPIIEDLALHYGMCHALQAVRAVDLPVLSLDADPDHARALLRREIIHARDHDRAEAVILGCAGMSDMCQTLSDETGIAVIDGVHAAVRLAGALAGGGYKTAKTGAYGWPRDKSGDQHQVSPLLKPAQ
ncbi:aspartate/glutamate racemase family protein [Roseinatronobacter sp. S2]|uniref:aspartate/glutamate racemase family protein n=1 Tax=Roseinatronobacter sp. S2 TaxID=3035471 RepID=UPI00240EFB37|nr:aspartate/glutamate racemase family protein [Roseinatronobacter sp. S2]WFE74304.1 aspartate/glutamate racemase family protein [Roseinatronobacter sp. S2]